VRSNNSPAEPGGIAVSKVRTDPYGQGWCCWSEARLARLCHVLTLFPVVDRELRTAARRSKTQWVRLAAAAAALLVSAWVCLWTAKTQTPVTAGRWLFTYLTVLGFGYCLLIGPFITADCISEEKREGTLGLLFLTELRSYEVVLGKWTAHALAGLYGLLAILPALGIPLLMGGVTPAEYGRTAMAVVNAILFSLTAGMLVSTLSRDQSKAILGSALVILGFSGLLPGLAALVGSGFFARPLPNPLPAAWISPAYCGYLATETVYRAAPNAFWISLGVVHALSWLFMVLTVLWVPRIWRDSPEEKPIAHRWMWRLGYTSGWRAAFKRRLDRNPVFAVAARLRWPHWVFWGLVSLVAANVYWLTYGYRSNTGASSFHVYFSHALVFMNRVWLCVMACRFWLEARRTGALELILTTPLPVRTLLRGHWRALWWLFAGPVAAIALLHLLYVEENWRLTAQRGPFGTMLLQSYMTAAACSLINFLTDILAICWLGAWLSLSSRRPTYVILKTFAWVVLAPWTLGVLLPNLSSVMPPRVMGYLNTLPLLRSLAVGGVSLFSVLRAAAWVGKNLVIIGYARARLHRHLRSAAAQTYGWGRDGSPGRLRRWLCISRRPLPLAVRNESKSALSMVL